MPLRRFPDHNLEQPVRQPALNAGGSPNQKRAAHPLEDALGRDGDHEPNQERDERFPALGVDHPIVDLHHEDRVGQQKNVDAGLEAKREQEVLPARFERGGDILILI